MNKLIELKLVIEAIDCKIEQLAELRSAYVQAFERTADESGTRTAQNSPETAEAFPQAKDTEEC